MIPCGIIHEGNSCTYDLILKALKVMKKSYKLYTFLYITLFLIRFSKNKHQKKLLSSIQKTCKNYVFSMLFMAWLACGIKAA